MNNKLSLRNFQRKYGTNEQCLEAIKKQCFPDGMECAKCKRMSVFYHIKGRTAYNCKFCNYQIYPLAGTIFEKTTTPLQYWCYVFNDANKKWHFCKATRTYVRSYIQDSMENV